MNKTSKKRMIIAIGISFITMVVAIIVGTFIFNHYSFLLGQGSVQLDFGSKENFIYITNSLPMGDEMGKKLDGKGTKEGVQGYLEFIVKEQKGKQAIFEIYLKKKAVPSEILGKNIKLYLTDMKDVPVEGFRQQLIPSFSSLNEIQGKKFKILYRGTIDAFEEKKYKLRMWLADVSSMETTKKEFKMELGVRVY